MKKPKKTPSRIKYEQRNPTISARLPVETRDKLLANLKILGMSVADAFRVLAGELEVKVRPSDEARQLGYKEAKNRYMVTFPCSICGELMPITGQKAKEAVGKYMTEHGWHHTECPKQKRQS